MSEKAAEEPTKELGARRTERADRVMEPGELVIEAGVREETGGDSGEEGGVAR